MSVLAREGEDFSRIVALKVVKRGMDTNEIVRRFTLERQLLGGLNHPNIAALIDGGTTDDGRPCFVMEHVEGHPIDRYRGDHRMSISQRVTLFRKVCAAVHQAHQNLIVHRGLKPGNILITKEGEPKLQDFGNAKALNPGIAQMVELTGPELRLMTPEYASPEQVPGDPITTSCDVYAGRAAVRTDDGAASVPLPHAAAAAVVLGGALAAWQWQKAEAANRRTEAALAESQRRFGVVRDLASTFMRGSDGITCFPTVEERRSMVEATVKGLEALEGESPDAGLRAAVAAAYQRLGDVPAPAMASWPESERVKPTQSILTRIAAAVIGGVVCSGLAQGAVFHVRTDAPPAATACLGPRRSAPCRARSVPRRLRAASTTCGWRPGRTGHRSKGGAPKTCVCTAGAPGPRRCSRSGTSRRRDASDGRPTGERRASGGVRTAGGGRA